MKRKPYIDILRIISTYSIVLLHTISLKWSEVTLDSSDFAIMMVYETLVRYAVPMFFMLSGALMLENKEHFSYRKLFSHNILHIVIVYLLWSILISCWDKLIAGGSLLTVDFKSAIVNGYWQLWFLLPLIGLYILIPIFQKIVMNERVCWYYVVLGFTFAVFIPFLIQIGQRYYPFSRFNTAMQDINTVVAKIDMRVVCNYGFYYVIGYLLSQAEFSKTERHALYITGILTIIIAIILNIQASRLAGNVQEPFSGHYNLLVFTSTIAFFVAVKTIVGNMGERMNENNVMYISTHCIGVYVLHIPIRNLLNSHGISSISFNPLLAAPLVALLIFLIAGMIAVLIRKVPIIGKRIL